MSESYPLRRPEVIGFSKRHYNLPDSPKRPDTKSLILSKDAPKGFLGYGRTYMLSTNTNFFIMVYSRFNNDFC